MSRLVRVAAAALLLFGVALARDLALPRAAFACSCARPPASLAEYRTQPEVRILSGSIVALNGQSGMFGIEQAFKGPVSGPAMPIEGGDPAMCGLGLKLGMRLVLAAWTEGDVLQANGCMLSAVLPSPEGDALLADALASYGGVAPPGEGPVEPTDAPTTAPGPVGQDLALPIILGGVVLAAVLLFGLVGILTRRSRSAA